VTVKVTIDGRLPVLFKVTRWQAALYSMIVSDTTLQKVNNHDCKPLSHLVDLISCLLDSSVLESALNLANTNGQESGVDFTDFDRYSYTMAQLLEIKGLTLRCAVSFDKRNGLTGNLSNVEVESTSKFLCSLSSSFWDRITGESLGSTVSQNLENNWCESVKSYLGNGRDTRMFHFTIENEYLQVSIAEPDEKNLVHLPVDPKDISLKTSKGWISLGPVKPNLAEYAVAKGGKNIFSSNRLRLRVGVEWIEKEIDVRQCLLDPSTANPLINVEKVGYFAGFAKLMLDSNTGKYSLHIPVVIKRSLDYSGQLPHLERKNRFHTALPGIQLY
jgi:hypothetical protein